MIILSVRTFASGRSIAAYGLSFGLLSLPVVQIFGTVLLIALAAGTVAGGVLFWAVVALGLVEGIVRTSLNKPAVQVCYRPLSPARRAVAQTVVETIADPGASAIAGLLLLGLNAAMADAAPSSKVTELGVLMLAALLGLLVISFSLRREHANVVIDALSRGHLKRAKIAIDEPQAIQIAEARLAGANAGEVPYAMKVLEQLAGREHLTRLSGPFLAHPSPEVRRRALELVEQDRLSGLRAAVLERLAPEQESDAGVRGAAAMAFAALDRDRSVAVLAPQLSVERVNGTARAEIRLVAEAREAAWICAALIDAGENSESEILRRALARELERTRDRIVSLLSFICPAQPVLWARRHLKSGSPEKKAYELEVIDTLASRRVRALVFTLFEDRGPRATWERLSRRAPEPLLGREDRMRQLILGEASTVTPWIRAAAIHAVGTGRERQFSTELARCANEPEDLVRETAAWEGHRIFLDHRRRYPRRGGGLAGGGHRQVGRAHHRGGRGGIFALSPGLRSRARARRGDHADHAGAEERLRRSLGARSG